MCMCVWPGQNYDVYKLIYEQHYCFRTAKLGKKDWKCPFMKKECLFPREKK